MPAGLQCAASAGYCYSDDSNNKSSAEGSEDLQGLVVIACSLLVLMIQLCHARYEQSLVLLDLSLIWVGNFG